MADRSTFNGASTNVPWQDTAETPEGFGNQYARHIKALYDASALPLTSVGGTGDNVTATVDPSLPPGGLRDGMKFGITWAAANSGPMTLTITGAGAAPVLSADGAVAGPGLAVVGGRALLEYVGGAFRVLSGGAGSGGAARYYWQFTASGTWTKPAGLPDDTMVTVEMWGGGGGGSSATGGGGGYARFTARLADLPATVPVTVGAGGAVGGNGGGSTFGALLTAYGGGGGRGGSAGNAGAGSGAGELGPGALGEAGSDKLGAAGGAVGGGRGGQPQNSTASGRAGLPGTGYGGGGGSVQSTSGGASVYGGGGGGAPGGLSLYGGNGGDPGQPGQAPGGGGGTSSAGARGEVRIWI